MKPDERALRLGDRVRVQGWDTHEGREGEVVDASPGYDTVYVLFDDDRQPSRSHWPENGGREVVWSASALEAHLELVEPVEVRLSLTPHQLKVWDELEARVAWTRSGDGKGNWGPWEKGWLTPRSSAESRALGRLADHGLIERSGGRPSSKIPFRFRPLCWDPRQAPADDDLPGLR